MLDVNVRFIDASQKYMAEVRWRNESETRILYELASWGDTEAKALDGLIKELRRLAGEADGLRFTLLQSKRNVTFGGTQPAEPRPGRPCSAHCTP